MRHLTPLFAAAALVLSTAPAYAANPCNQLAKLLANDASTLDNFGVSVAISGDIALVGAHGHNDFGIDSGAAYLFDISDPENPTQLAKLLAPKDDAAEDDLFGWAVAISGTTAIVVAIGDDDNGFDSGSAFLFDISDPANPISITKILPNDGQAGDRFGRTIETSGTTVIFGAPRDDDNGPDSGSAYLFDLSDPANPVQLAKLLASDGAANDGFGFGVAIDGSIAIVGAWGNDDLGFESGSAYLFDIATGDQIAKFLPNDGANGDQFGVSVAISGAIAMVGANGDGNFRGSAYLFDLSNPASPVQIAKLVPVGGGSGAQFGWVVAISGPAAIVGAPLDNDNGTDSGAAYLFDISDPASPTLIDKFLANDGQIVDNFGVSVAIDGSIAIIGAWGNDDNGSSSGSAYLFEVDACPADFSRDGAVGPLDLAILLGNWGPNPGHPADLDCNGGVGPFDLAILLGDWGPCP